MSLWRFSKKWRFLGVFHDVFDIVTAQVNLLVQGFGNPAKGLAARHQDVVVLFHHIRLYQLEVIAGCLEPLVVRVALVEFRRQVLHERIEVAGEILAHQKFRDVARHGDMRVAFQLAPGDVGDTRAFLGLVHLHVVDGALEQVGDERVARLVVAQLLEFLFSEEFYKGFAI